MKDIFKQAASLLSQHADGDFVSKTDAFNAAASLHDIMLKFDQWHWIEQALDELKRAEEKHPNWPEDAIYALAIVGEEYGEALREAVKIEMTEPDRSVDNLKKELIQVMVTCLRTLKNLQS
ncbi:hypothetical protein C7T94_07805 [Pedobacter yulinensis]|uniref:Uncharacterized protein n=1 Tax=Pedobacter yulinensis TaxID=2126353 RepID=A0A2T3HJE6_9SPHI|nr:hypothetical protein [Pedobacter yulinensis]PST82564.1 hypothetical protein C7T94_07805 [Pedobacter yulinensis]